MHIMYNFEYCVPNKSVQVERELAVDDVKVTPETVEPANDIDSPANDIYILRNLSNSRLKMTSLCTHM